ncbi:hypothetical protein F0562_023771 [Nyssa sinensis]|uniref:RNase H type-1 domain-containing protein n=1 Tax=Nyssa sinensis TaxID=561372 RepID=A0A5J5BIN2_9ASTE|nr:hypothetical protein F0562_023771 [Nyssa sinensis]
MGRSGVTAKYGKKVVEGLGKTKVVASNGMKKVKEGTSLRLQWMKNKGLVFAKEIGIRDLVFESACRPLIFALASPVSELSVLGRLIDDIKLELVGFHSISFLYVRTEANSVAHAITAYVQSLDSEECWLEELPSTFSYMLYKHVAPTGNGS